MTWICNKDRKTEKQAFTGLSHDVDLHHRQEDRKKALKGLSHDMDLHHRQEDSKTGIRGTVTWHVSATKTGRQKNKH